MSVMGLHNFCIKCLCCFEILIETVAISGLGQGDALQPSIVGFPTCVWWCTISLSEKHSRSNEFQCRFVVFFSGSYSNTCPVSPVYPWSCHAGQEPSHLRLCLGPLCFAGSDVLPWPSSVPATHRDVPNYCSRLANAGDLPSPPREGIGCRGALSRRRNRTPSR